MKKLYGSFIFIILIAIDQISKLFIVNNFLLGEEKEVIHNVFSIEYIRNTGAAWGMFPNGTVFFVIFSVIVCMVLLFLYYKIPNEKKYNYLSIVIIMLVSGAVGNLIDRCFRKYVVDFFYFKLIDFPIFNVADIYVTVSAIILILLIMFYYKEDDFEFIKISCNKEKKTEKNISELKGNNEEDNRKDNKKDDKEVDIKGEINNGK